VSDDLPKSLFEALARFQADLPEVTAARTGHVSPRDQDKQGYDFAYADLDDVTRVVLPRLGALGLAWITKPAVKDGQWGLSWALVHWPSEQRDDGFYELPASGDLPQRGKLLSFARRQVLCAVTGIAPRRGEQPRSGRRGGGQRQAAGDAWEDATPGRPQQDGGGWLAAALNAAPNLATIGACEAMLAKSVEKNQAGEISNSDAARLQGTLKAREKTLRDAQAGSGGEPDPTRPAAPAATPTGTDASTATGADGHSEPVGEGQLGAIARHFARLGYGADERQQRLTATSVLAGRTITTSKDLTQAEAVTVAARLSRCKDRDKLAEILAQTIPERAV